MKSLALNLNGEASIDWNSVVDGIDNVKQKTIVGMMTRRGSDEVVVDRGTDLQQRLLGAGGFDLMGIQHELNFAAVKTEQDMRPFVGTDLASNLSRLDMRLSGLEGGRAVVYLSITNQAGATVGTTTTI